MGLIHRPIQTFWAVLIIPLAFATDQARARESEDSSRLTSHTWVDIDGTSLFVSAIGQGKPLVVIHGGPGLDHTYLLHPFLPLAADHRLIFYDQRYTGRSSPDIDTSALTIEKFVDDLEHLRIALQLDRINLLGHSWGGLLAMHYAIKHPDHVRSLILVGSTGASSEYLSEFIAKRNSRITPADSAMMAEIASSTEFTRGDSAAVNAYVSAVFRGYFHDRTASQRLRIEFSPQTTSNFLTIYGFLSRAFSSYDLHPMLEKVSTPTLIIHGEHDPIPWKYAEKIHHRIKHSRFVLLEQSGHFPFIETPARLLEECKLFLKNRR